MRLSRWKTRSVEHRSCGPRKASKADAEPSQPCSTRNGVIGTRRSAPKAPSLMGETFAELERIVRA